MFLASLARNPGIAFGEELAFRGQILGRLSERVSFGMAAVLSSLLYAGSHFGVKGFSPAAFGTSVSVCDRAARCRCWGAVAQLERALIAEPTKPGLRAARSRGLRSPRNEDPSTNQRDVCKRSFVEVADTTRLVAERREGSRAGGLRPATGSERGPVLMRLTVDMCLPRLNSACPNPRKRRESFGFRG
jgi:hypothetical protein